MASVERGGEFVLTSGVGAVVVDDAGREYLDLTAGLWFANVGHGRTEIADAMGAQAGQLAAYSTFGDMANRPVLELADRLASIAPMADAKVFFTSGGSDSVDTAAKLVRRYWSIQGHPGRTTIITRERAYHGMHWGGTALAGISANRSGYGEWGADVATVAWNDVDDLVRVLDQLVDEEGGSTAAAFYCEPVIGAGGVHYAGEPYLAAARQLCRDRGVLWVSDEVITGYGRLGEWFASTRFDLAPDLVLSAKGLTSGYAPMGAVLVAPTVSEPFWNGAAGMWRHGYTYSGHAVGAAAALANLDVLEREGLVARVRELEPVLADTFGELVQHDLVSEVRAGVGLLAAVQLTPEAVSADPSLPQQVIAELRGRGILTRGLVDGSLQVSPPFVVTADQLKNAAAGCWDALEAVQQVRKRSV
ncbi:MAG: aspartate aminotransferase family protein [Actinomycetes bacterium]